MAAARHHQPLPPDLRAVVHLFYVEGYATEEIATIVECQPGTVRTRLHRARQQLKTTLQNEKDAAISARTEPERS